MSTGEQNLLADLAEFNYAQAHVLMVLGGRDGTTRCTIGALCHQMEEYVEPELVQAAVDRLWLVGLVRRGGSNEVWATPQARYLSDIGALEE